MNRALLKQYILLVDFLSQVLGPDYEIALHDLSDKNNSIVAIANGHISGRTLGAPLSPGLLQSIMKSDYAHSNYRISYSGVASDNKMLRSSSLYIKSATGKLEGLLCINFDDSRYQELSAKVLQLCHPDAYVQQNIVIRDDLMQAEPIDTEGSDSLTSIATAVVEEVVSESGLPADRLTQAEKIRIVSLLNQRGVFFLKGAVNYVSKVLLCSPATIYRYLNKADEGG